MGKPFPDNGSGRSSGPVQATVNGTVLLVGVVMIVTPGPAVVMIPLGLAILAIEFAWARRLLKRVREQFPNRAAARNGAKKPAGEADPDAP